MMRLPRRRSARARRPAAPAPVRLYARLMLRKGPEASLLSHLELARTFERACRRAGLPLGYSAGYNPRPRISFASALALGATSDGELVAVELTRRMPPEELLHALNRQLPRGLEATAARVLPRGKRDPFADIGWARYDVRVDAPQGIGLHAMRAAITHLLARPSIERLRSAKGGRRRARARPGAAAAPQAHKRVDLRPLIDELQASQDSPNVFTLSMLLAVGERHAKPQEVVSALAEQVGELAVRHVHRVSLHEAPTAATSTAGGL